MTNGQKIVTDEIVAEWAAMCDAGLSCREIAKRTGFGKTAVTNHLKSIGKSVSKRFPTPEEVDEWVEAFNSGISPYELASKYGFSDETIRTHLKKRGITMRRQGGPLKYDHEQDEIWKRDYLSGMTEDEVAGKYGVSATTVSTRLRAMGTEMRTRAESRRRVTTELSEIWIEEYRNGKSSVEIADEYGFSSTTILAYLHEAGVDTVPIIGPSELDQICNRYVNGTSISDLATEYGVTNNYIRMKLNDAGLPIRPPERGYQFSEDTIEDWVERYASGESLKSIAFSAGLKSSDPVRKRLVAAGVEIRDKVSTTSSSWQEWAIYFYLKKAYPDYDVANNKRVDTKHGARFPDVSVMGNGLKLAVEYDGEFWHNTKEHRLADESKTEALEKEGFRVIRVIENSRDENKQTGNVIFCTAEREGIETGIGFAISVLLDMLYITTVSVDLARDTQEISKLYYQAKNRASHGLEWVKLYEGGLSTNSIASEYGVTATTVSNALKSLGMSIRHAPTAESEIDLWIELFETGKLVQEIADERGVNKTTVYRALKKRGVSFDHDKRLHRSHKKRGGM